MILIYCLTLEKCRPSWILSTMQCLMYFLASPLQCMSGITENSMVDTRIINLLFDLEIIVAIFYFTHNAMSNVLLGLTTMPCIAVKSYGGHQNHKSASILSKWH